MSGTVIVFALRLVLSIFLGLVGVILGYLFAWAVALSLPGGSISIWSIRLLGVGIGAASGAILAWWDTDTGIRYRLAIIPLVMGAGIAGAWLGETFGPPVRPGPTREAVQQFTPVAFGAVIISNLAAFAPHGVRLFTYIGQSRRKGKRKL